MGAHYQAKLSLNYHQISSNMHLISSADNNHKINANAVDKGRTQSFPLPIVINWLHFAGYNLQMKMPFLTFSDSR